MLFIILKVIPEMGKGFDKRAASRHDFGTPARAQIDRCKLLKDPHRIVRSKHCYRTRQPDILCDRGSCGQQNQRVCGDIILTGKVTYCKDDETPSVTQPYLSIP